MLNLILLCLFFFCGGIIIAGGVFAFIAIIGIVPRFAQKTNTSQYIKIYEEAIMLGGIFGTLTMLFDFRVPTGQFGNVVAGLFYGIFVGCLAVSIAEVIDVIPILCRRASIKQGISIFIIMIALGKTIGSLAYFLLPELTQFK